MTTPAIPSIHDLLSKLLLQQELQHQAVCRELAELKSALAKRRFQRSEPSPVDPALLAPELVGQIERFWDTFKAPMQLHKLALTHARRIRDSGETLRQLLDRVAPQVVQVMSKAGGTFLIPSSAWSQMGPAMQESWAGITPRDVDGKIDLYRSMQLAESMKERQERPIAPAQAAPAAASKASPDASTVPTPSPAEEHYACAQCGLKSIDLEEIRAHAHEMVLVEARGLTEALPVAKQAP